MIPNNKNIVLLVTYLIVNLNIFKIMKVMCRVGTSANSHSSVTLSMNDVILYFKESRWSIVNNILTCN